MHRMRVVHDPSRLGSHLDNRRLRAHTKIPDSIPITAPLGAKEVYLIINLKRSNVSRGGVRKQTLMPAIQKTVQN